MTREEKLYSMRMVELAEVAEKLGIKIDKKGSKSKAIEKILAAEEMNKQNEKELAKEAKDSLEISNAIAAEFEESLAGDGTPLAEVGKEIAEQAKKKAKKAKAEKKTSKKADAIDVIAITEDIVKSLNADYKRSRDGIGIFNADSKRVLDIWKRSTRVRMYISSDDRKYNAVAKSKLIENLHDNPSKSAKLDKSFYVEANNVQKFLEMYLR